MTIQTRTPNRALAGVLLAGLVLQASIATPLCAADLPDDPAASVASPTPAGSVFSPAYLARKTKQQNLPGNLPLLLPAADLPQPQSQSDAAAAAVAGPSTKASQRHIRKGMLATGLAVMGLGAILVATPTQRERVSLTTEKVTYTRVYGGVFLAGGAWLTYKGWKGQP